MYSHNSQLITRSRSIFYLIARPHLLIHCQNEETQTHREELKKALGGRLDLRQLLDTPDGARAASRWVLHSGRLPQFSLARTLLYE